MFTTIEEYFRNLLKLPENANKKKWEEIFNAMAVHTRQVRPDLTLLKRRPNEEPAIHQYRLDNFRHITYGSMNKALDDLFRIVNQINYTPVCPDDFKKWLNETKFTGYGCDTQNEQLNLELFLQKVVLKRMIEDPNGFLVWLPTGKGLTDNSTAIEVKPELVYSSNHRYSDEKVFIYKTNKVVPLQDGEEVSYTGEVYYFLTKTEFWQMYQEGDKSEPKWTQELVYTHNLGAFPVITMGGDMTSDGYYNSFFGPYLAFGDEAISLFSDHQGVNTICAFPFIEEFASECTFRMVEKQIPIPGGGEENFRKEVTLVPMSKNPYNVTLRPIPNGAVNQDVLDANIPSRRYISPQVDILKYLGEQWEKMLEKAEDSLNIDMTVGTEQSGKAKQLDKESQYSMITKIGNNFFDNVYKNSLQLVYAYTNKKSLQEVSNTIGIIKPATFWVKNEDDLVWEISTLKEKNVPSFFLAEATLELAKKRFAGNKVAEKIFQVIALYDPLYTYTVQEKQILVAGATISKESFTQSIYMWGILNQIAVAKGAEAFLAMDADKIKAEFDVLVQPFIPQPPQPIVITPTTPTA